MPWEREKTIPARFFRAGMAGFDPTEDNYPLIMAVPIGDTEGAFALATMQPPLSSSNVSTSGTHNVKAGSGLLDSIVVNAPVGGLIANIYDNTSGSGTTIANITIPALTDVAPFAIPYRAPFTTGLTIVLSAVSDLTVLYR